MRTTTGLSSAIHVFRHPACFSSVACAPLSCVVPIHNSAPSHSSLKSGACFTSHLAIVFRTVKPIRTLFVVLVGGIIFLASLGFAAIFTVANLGDGHSGPLRHEHWRQQPVLMAKETLKSP
jgi:hypothetical protein